jgi:hypothetical protein
MAQPAAGGFIDETTIRSIMINRFAKILPRVVARLAGAHQVGGWWFWGLAARLSGGAWRTMEELRQQRPAESREVDNAARPPPFVASDLQQIASKVPRK